MFDFDTTKLLLIGVVALAVIPPKDLPRVIRQVGQAVGKVRRMAAEFQGQVMEALKEAELDDLKKEITSITDSAKAEVTAITDAAKIDIDINPAAEAQREITKAIEAEPLTAMGGGPADMYARATTAPAALEPALPAAPLPPVNEKALASLAMPEAPLPPAPPPVTHDLIAAQAGIGTAADGLGAPKASRTVDLRKPQAASSASSALLPAVGAEMSTEAKMRKPRARKGDTATAGAATPKANGAAVMPLIATEGGERVPFRKRVAYMPPARAARAARRES